MSVTTDQINAAEIMERDDLVKTIKTMMKGVIVLNFYGKRADQEIGRKVRPSQTIIKKEFSIGTLEEQARNMIVEGKHFRTMVTLYKDHDPFIGTIAVDRAS